MAATHQILVAPVAVEIEMEGDKAEEARKRISRSAGKSLRTTGSKETNVEPAPPEATAPAPDSASSDEPPEVEANV